MKINVRYTVRVITECVILIVGVFSVIFMLPVTTLQNQTTKLNIKKKLNPH